MLPNRDTRKQLLARGRYLLFKSPGKWTRTQKDRAEVLFRMYPSIHEIYQLAQELSYIFENNTDKNIAMTKMAHWYKDVEESGHKAFNTIARTFYHHYDSIMNYFNGSTLNVVESIKLLKCFQSNFSI